MPFNSRLKVVKGDYTKYFDLISLSNSLSSASIKADYKVIEGNRLSGIEQGIGLTSAGRVLNYAIPIFETREKNNLYKNIAEYTSLLQNSYSYNFFVEHNIDNVWYSAKVQINEIKGYSVDLTNYVKGFGFSVLMIDNNFLGDTVKDRLDLSGSGLQYIDYESKSLVPANISFEWTIQGTEATFSAWILHNDNYGIVVNSFIGGGIVTLIYNGESIISKKGSEENLIVFEGVQPFLDVGKNVLTINNNYNTVDFYVIYRKGISL